MDFWKKIFGKGNNDIQNITLGTSLFKSDFGNNVALINPMDILVLHAKKSSDNLIEDYSSLFSNEDEDVNRNGKAKIECVMFMLIRSRFSFQDDLRNFDPMLIRTVEKAFDDNYLKLIEGKFGSVYEFFANRAPFYSEEAQKLAQSLYPNMDMTYSMFFHQAMEKKLNQNQLSTSPQFF